MVLFTGVLLCLRSGCGGFELKILVLMFGTSGFPEFTGLTNFSNISKIWRQSTWFRLRSLATVSYLLCIIWSSLRKKLTWLLSSMNLMLIEFSNDGLVTRGGGWGYE